MGPRWMSPEARIERTRACFDLVVCGQLTTASAAADLFIRGRVGASDVEGEWAYAGICALPLGVVATWEARPRTVYQSERAGPQTAT